jgi:hypothetical protein
MGAETKTLTEVLLRIDPRDGNDPIEADVKLPMVPRKGDIIDVWIQESDPRQYASGNRSEYLTVKDVVLCTWAPERIEVWVEYEGYNLADVRRIFGAVERNEQP